MSQVKNEMNTKIGLNFAKGWVKTDLGKVIKIIGGGTPKTSVPEYWDGEIPWLSVVDFNDDNRWVNSTEKTITSLGLEKSSTKLLNEGDIIISARGTVGAMAQLKREMSFNQSCYGIRNIENISEIDFIFYLLKFSLKQINQNTYGAVFDTITTKTFDYININLPPLPEQKAIAKVLTAFDDKIENLRAQNDTLEQTAQTIFTEWFGKYQIGDLSADMAGELPEGWRVGTLNELITIIGGGTPKTSEKDYWDGNICWYSVVDAPNNHNCFVVNTEKKITPLGLAKSSTKILRKGTTIISARGTVGKLAITGCDMAMNQSCYGIQGKNLVGDYFIYFQIKQVLNILKNNVHGAVFDTITKSTLEEVPIIIASKKEILEIEIILEALMNKIFHNVLQIQTLSQTRDTILPKLMSGELRVKGFDR